MTSLHASVGSGPVMCFIQIKYAIKEVIIAALSFSFSCIHFHKLIFRSTTQAIRDIAFSKIQHIFANVHVPQKVLREMDNKTVNVVRKWLCLNTHSTRCFIFQKRQVGGLGVPNCMSEYTATRQSHLTNMLDCDDVSMRQMARASLLLDFKRRKVLHACGGEDSFLGFNRKTNGNLDGRAQGFGVSSDWPDLNDLCWRTGTELKWTSHYQPVEVSDVVKEDPSVIVEARPHHNNIVHLCVCVCV